ncbi:pleckstrin homology domain-containing family A member 1-like isoform X2 [Antedon mediterranea]|uniref:pleckstrin homology domain-containing family A member 1-like isoform X2 n=1 Tax=Antedon mediterranea TaxID=105859 RepID=UPI003AF797CE
MPYVDRHGRTCGYADIEDQNQVGKFYRRYFIIANDVAAFEYYMDNPLNLPKGSRPVGQILLSTISTARDAAKLRPKEQFCFAVSTPDKDYILRADGEEDKVEWMNKLNNASRIPVPKQKLEENENVENEKTDDDTLEGDTQNRKIISYRTEIVGGVVVRTPVEHDESTLRWNSLKLLLKTYFEMKKMSYSDSDSGDEEKNAKKSTLPSTSPKPPHLIPATIGRNVIKSGFCVKQGAVRKNWKRRFFVLDNLGISYFKSDQDKVPIRTIPQKDITSCKESPLGAQLQRDNLFEISCSGRIFYVQTYSPEELTDWVRCISGAIIATRAKGGSSGNNSLVPQMLVSSTLPALSWPARSLSHEPQSTAKIMNPFSRLSERAPIQITSKEIEEVEDTYF